MTDNFKHPSFLTDCPSFTSTSTQEQDYADILAERDEALNQLDSERHTVSCLQKRCKKWADDYAALQAKLDVAVARLKQLCSAAIPIFTDDNNLTHFSIKGSERLWDETASAMAFLAQLTKEDEQ